MGMISNIKTVATFEIKTLFRSWFFRIFSILTLLMLLGTNIGMLTENNGQLGWAIRSLSSNIPYFNIAFLNLAQAIIAIFLAADFLRRDKKLDTTEVIYTRSMTNWEYVWGKTIGVLIVFGALNFLIFAMVLIINVVVSGVVVHWVAYLVYPLLISFPTLIFTLGLAFLLMSLLRNQAVTLILLLGIAALSMFLLNDKVSYLFDYMAFSLPMMWSDFIGTGQNFMIILHRGIYLSLGLSMIFATILLLQRLPQSKSSSMVAALFLLIFSIGGLAGIGYYWLDYSKDKKYAEEIRSLNDGAKGEPTVKVLDYAIDFNHEGNNLTAITEMEVVNDTDANLTEALFSLNPGLELSDIQFDGKGIDYTRDEHLVLCSFDNGLSPGQTGKLQFNYSGSVDERICYLDISDEKLKEKHGPDFITSSQKRHAILEEDCIMLTPESVWYPIAGWTFGSRISVRPLRQFSNYSLKITTDSDILPISQGLMEKDGDAWVYTSETALPGISLAAANYEEKKIVVDSLELYYYHLPGHDVFTEHLPLIKDTLSSLISETLMDYERQLGLQYPYKSLKFVEAPVQFFAYKRIWTLTQDYVQPQMVLFPEKGCMLQRSNFKSEFDRSVRRSADRDDGRTDEEMQVGVFNNFVKSNFVEGSQNFSFRMGRGGPSFSSTSEKPYIIFPNYFYYINRIESEEYQIINATLESFMGNQSTETTGFMRNFGGVSDAEQANLSLSKNSLEELLKMQDDKDVLTKVIQAKGTYLFNYLEAAIGSDEFRTFILDLMAQNRFKSIDIQELAIQLEETYNVDLNSFLKRWYYEKELSSFLVTDVSNIELQSGDNTVYQIYFTISNIGDSEGVINVTFRTGGRGGMGGGRGGGGGGGFSMAGRDENTDRLFIIPAKTAQRVGLVMDDQVRMMSVNTLISNNLPASISYPFPELEQRNDLEAFDGILAADLVTSLVQDGEIIVDNEDPGFSIHEEGSSNKLSKWLSIDQTDSEFKYQPMMGFWGGAPLSWTATAQSGFYGDIIRSAYYIRSGEGNKYVEWTTEIEEEGYYDVSTYLDDMLKRMNRSRGRGGDRGSGGGSQDVKDEYHFTIKHSEGTEELTLAIKNIEDGWNNLGSYYFSTGTTTVTLSDKNVGRMVVADAIKWVKQ
jgi:ABC-type transport system involved in multi-copper enzyme maturation permease subunit